MSSWEAAGKTDDWNTPKYLFDALGCEFDLDVAAPREGPKYVPASAWLWEKSLEATWEGFAWANPLVPDRTSSPWFQWYAPLMDAVLFVAPKIKFERPDGTLGKSPGTGSALFGIGQQAVEAIVRGKSLGWLAKP